MSHESSDVCRAASGVLSAEAKDGICKMAGDIAPGAIS